MITDKYNFSLIGIIFLYIVSYNPFFFESFIDEKVRISIEITTLFLLFLPNLRSRVVDIFFGLLVIGTLYVFLLPRNPIDNLLGSFNKLFFLVLLLSILKNNIILLKYLIKSWIWFSFILCFSSIGAFLFFNFGVINFTPIDIGNIVSGIQGSYHFEFHPLLGNIDVKHFSNFDLGRASSFTYEGGLAAFIFGLNFFSPNSWFNSGKYKSFYIAANFLAGLATLSFAYLIFFCSYFLLKQLSLLFKYYSHRGVIIYLLLFTFLFFLLIPSFKYSSFPIRFDSSINDILLINNEKLINFLFGNGISFHENEYGGGINSGWIKLFLERGFFWFMSIIYLVVKLTKHNIWLLFFVLYYQLVFDLFFTPVSILFLAIAYSSLNYINKKSSRTKYYQNNKVRFSL
ncbi:hypothetical protein [Candidatus Methylopumilus planktonicus]|uniref:hypothetical protein n=1 Tax=Candidatus Methylopumilus planktonicus TaxID=1581557 RepID=UPI003D18DC7A